MENRAIEGLKPELLWQRFAEISNIPRPSKKEEKILKFLIDFANEHNLAYKQDSVGNIVMKVPATAGLEDKPVIVLQSHVDMVCEKNSDKIHDFDNDPITLVKDGEWIKADNTTLGADNGIGVAAALAVVDDKTSVHGPLELLFTVDEETGLTGANGLETGLLEGKYLLNMDSEEDGAFYIGCSGGLDTVAYFDIPFTDNKKEFSAYRIFISGLKGGHSGLDVANGRANAIKIAGILLHNLSTEVKYRIASINGGSKRNAIPRETEIIITFESNYKEIVELVLQRITDNVMMEYKTTDPGLKISLSEYDSKVKKVFKKGFTKRLINVINALPNGIIKMSFDVEGLVETSTNLATIFTVDGSLRIGTSQRSSIEPAKDNIGNTVKSIFELAEAEDIVTGDGYPGWQPNPNSELLKFSKNVFVNLFNKEPEVKAIHAGLECGILGSKYPELDMISFGPTIIGAHSPEEKVNIGDVEKFYELLKMLLKEIAEKK